MKKVHPAFSPGTGELCHILKTRAIETLTAAAKKAGMEFRAKVAEGTQVIAASPNVKRLMSQHQKAWEQLHGDKNYSLRASFSYCSHTSKGKVAEMCLVHGHHGGSGNIWHLLTSAERAKLKRIQSEAQQLQGKATNLNNKICRVEESNAASLYLDGMDQRALSKLDEIIKLLPKLTSKLLD